MKDLKKPRTASKKTTTVRKPAAKKPAAPKSAAAPPAAAKARKTPRKAASPKGPLKVRDLMTSELLVTNPAENLAAAANKMWTADCGCLPVVEGDGALAGWITDRDICMAVAMQAAPAGEISVKTVMNGPVHQCRDTDSVQDALGQMSKKQVRRLAVTDAEDRLVGVLSITDLVRAAKTRPTKGAPGKTEVLDVIQALGVPHEVTVEV